MKHNRRLFEIVNTRVQVNHSEKGSLEEASEVILNGTLRIGAHTDTSNRVVANSRYAVLLGMPWLVAKKPNIDYVKRVVKVGTGVIPVDSYKQWGEPVIQVTNLGLENFRRDKKEGESR